MTQKRKTSTTQKRRTAQSDSSGQRRLVLVVGIGAVLMVAAVIAVVLTLGSTPLAEPAAQPVAISGTPLPAYAADSADPAVGMTLPSLSGIGLDGQALTIAPDGRAKAIMVLAHWCPHCQAEVPRIVAWLSSNSVPDGVDLVAVTTAISETRPNYPPSEWLSSVGWQQPTLIDDANSSAYRALGGMAFPGWVFVTADGVVQLRTTGEMAVSDFAALLDQIAP